MKIYNCEQGSVEWTALRSGVVTASEIGALVTPLFATRKGEGVETFLAEKLCEKLIGWVPDSDWSTYAVDQGKLNEKTALPYYNFSQDAEARRVGFCLSDDGTVGCSPDGLVGDDGGLEIKSPRPPVHLKTHLRQEVPDDHIAQVHFSLYVTGRAWWDYLSFSRQGLPNVLIRVKRDEAIITKIQAAVGPFLARLAVEFEKLDVMRQADREADGKLHKADLDKMRAATPDGELAGEKWLRERAERGQ